MCDKRERKRERKKKREREFLEMVPFPIVITAIATKITKHVEKEGV